MESSQFISYAHQELARKRIIKYASQYKDVNMAKLIGVDEDHFPFIVDDGSTVSVCFWNPYSGIMMHLDEDQVREHATLEYLREHTYPIFSSFKAAENHSAKREWPRKNQLTE